MNLGQRVKTIYVKELIDILRDRRTLIAMIVVPILLYPLLMLGTIQAASTQAEKLDDEKVTIVVPNAEQAKWVLKWLNEDAGIARELGVEEPRPIKAKIINLEDVREDRPQVSVEDLIRARKVQLGVSVELHNAGAPANQRQYRVKPFYDPEEIRSADLQRRFAKVLERREKHETGGRLNDLGVPLIVIEPFVLEPEEVTTPGSILGQILPLILVLMTITGAIYPAIDLTAGERERGTLETLMVCPVPVVDLVVGKFLVVTTVAIMGAALNLASVSATVYFGGFEAVVSAAGDERFPLGALPLILLSLVPFAILMSAIMIAVCSYARTFKEAQNYVTPVILAVLIPGGVAALPATRLEGVMLVMPVDRGVDAGLSLARSAGGLRLFQGRYPADIRPGPARRAICPGGGADRADRLGAGTRAGRGSAIRPPAAGSVAGVERGYAGGAGPDVALAGPAAAGCHPGDQRRDAVPRLLA